MAAREPMGTKITAQIALEIAHHEAIIRQAYKDSVGVWTWSAGITSASGHKVERYIDNPQTMKRCLEVYIWLLEEKYAPAVRKAFEGHKLTDAQFAAALSFHWNTGAIGRASWVKHFKAGNIPAAKKAFMSWRKPSEIIPRREKERDLFFDGKWTSDGKIAEYTRLTSRNTPVWGSRVSVDVRADIEALLGQPETPIARELPPLGVLVTGPKQEKPTPSPFAALVAAFLTLFKKG